MMTSNKIASLKVEKATYIDGYKLSIAFTDGKHTVVDFRPFLDTVKGGFLEKYKNPVYFKKFNVAEGNIVWGKDWDLVFPVAQLYQGKIKIKS